MINVGVVGYGYWGPNLVRNFFHSELSQVVACCDLNPDRLKTIKRLYPQIEVTQHAEDVFRKKDVDAVAIATPLSTHFELVKSALDHGKHVLVEKPMASSVNQAEELIRLAERDNRVLMVDHTFIFTGAVRKIREVMDKQELGDIFYFDSVRVNLGLFQHDINVVWDLAPHDISIMDHVIDKKPIWVSAIGASHFKSSLENIAYLTVGFHDEAIAHVHVNWTAPVKVRKVLIGGSEKMLVYDDLEPSEKIKIYDKGVSMSGDFKEDIYRTLVEYRTGDMNAPKVDTTEALQTECQHFLECIREGRTPITDGHAGLRVVRILEASTESIKNHGKPVALE